MKPNRQRHQITRKFRIFTLATLQLSSIALYLTISSSMPTAFAAQLASPPAGNLGLLRAGVSVVRLLVTTQQMAGTLPYVAPEQIRGKPQPASDQYSLGVVVYEWLCGSRPFQGSSEWEIMNQHLSSPPPSLRENNSTISEKVEQIVLKALAKDPQQRFASVADFAKALASAV